MIENYVQKIMHAKLKTLTKQVYVLITASKNKMRMKIPTHTNFTISHEMK